MSTAVAIQAAQALEVRKKKAKAAAQRRYQQAKSGYQQKDRVFTWAEFLVLAGITGFAVWRYNNRYIRKSSGGGGTGTTGGGVETSTGWNPEWIAGEIKDKIEGYNLYQYPDLAQQVLALNDEELTLLNTHYNQYFAEEYPTMRQLFAAEFMPWGLPQYYQSIADRLTGMGLNDGPQQNAPTMANLIIVHRLKSLGL